jgi:hypothetical protein
MGDKSHNFRALPEFCEVSSGEEDDIIPPSQRTEHDALRSLNRFWRNYRRERAERPPSPPVDDYESVNQWLPADHENGPEVDPDLSIDAEQRGESSSSARTVMMVDSLEEFSDLELPFLPISQLSEEQRKPPESPWAFRHVPVPVLHLSSGSETETSDEAGYENAQRQVRAEIDWGSDNVEELVQASQKAEDATTEVPASDEEAVPERPSDGEAAEKRPSDGEAAEKRPSDGEAAEKRPSDGEPTDGGPTEQKRRKLQETVDENFLDLR